MKQYLILNLLCFHFDDEHVRISKGKYIMFFIQINLFKNLNLPGPTFLGKKLKSIFTIYIIDINKNRFTFVLYE